MPTNIWYVDTPDFEWGDLPADEEAARVAAKYPKTVTSADPSAEPGPPNWAPGSILRHSRGGDYQLLQREITPTKADGVPYLVTHQYGVCNLRTGVATWAPPGSEGPTRPDVTVNVVRDRCGIVSLERKVAALEAQVRAQQARIADLEQVRVRVLRTGGS